tara:strand:- start:197 stop:415 length:219 start_codon:yes stop_codon:yes gene_type:complete
VFDRSSPILIFFIENAKLQKKEVKPKSKKQKRNLKIENVNVDVKLMIDLKFDLIEKYSKSYSYAATFATPHQ